MQIFFSGICIIVFNPNLCFNLYDYIGLDFNFYYYLRVGVRVPKRSNSTLKFHFYLLIYFERERERIPSRLCAISYAVLTVQSPT